MLILGVGVLIAIDLTILTMYIMGEGIRGTLDAKLVPHTERTSTTEGVRIVESMYVDCHTQ